MISSYQSTNVLITPRIGSCWFCFVAYILFIFHNVFYIDRTAIGGSDWSFKTSISCSNITPSNFLQEKKKKRQNVPKCDAEYGKLEHLERINDSFPLFGSRDNCIRKKINTFCKTDLVVPNIVHYIWFGRLKFDFIYFVSMYSAFKHQNPCVIFVYYDILPSGEYWTLLLDVVPNIILVNVTSPSEISGRKITYVQHKSDILRLLILKGRWSSYSNSCLSTLTRYVTCRKLDNTTIFIEF